MSFNWSQRAAPDITAIEQLAHETLTRLPGEIAERAADVAIIVADRADAEMLAELEIDDDHDLTGLYEGTPLTEKHPSEQSVQPDIIHLFRKPILAEWVERNTVSLGDLVAHIVIHELAHHFGWTDDDIAAIDRWWE